MLFKSLTRLAVEEFDDIYNKETTKRYDKHESSVYQKEKNENRFLVLLVYYRLYITYTLSSFYLI